MLAALILASFSSVDVHPNPPTQPYVELDTMCMASSLEGWAELVHGEIGRTLRVVEGRRLTMPKVILAPLGSTPESEAQYTERVVTPRHPFRDVLLSWNVGCPKGCGFVVELRVGREQGDEWSPWMFAGEWGDVPTIERTLACEGGRIEAGRFHGTRTFDRARVRMRAFAAGEGIGHELLVERRTLCFSDPSLLVDPAIEWSAFMNCSPTAWPKLVFDRRIDVPFRSRSSEKADIVARMSNPAALGMVLAIRGVDRPTSEIAALLRDARNDSYDDSSRIIQTAYSLGVPGYSTRFTNWDEVERMLAVGQPIVCRLTVKKTELHGAPYKSVESHAIVLTGLRSGGDCLVSDPAAADEKHGELVYARSEMQTVWLDRGGLAFVLEARP